VGFDEAEISVLAFLSMIFTCATSLRCALSSHVLHSSVADVVTLIFACWTRWYL